MMKVVSFPFSLLFFTSILQSMDEFDENKLPFEQHLAVRQWHIQAKAFARTLAAINECRVNRKRSKLSVSYLEREVRDLMKFHPYNPRFAELSFDQARPFVAEKIKRARTHADKPEHDYFVFQRIKESLTD